MSGRRRSTGKTVVLALAITLTLLGIAFAINLPPAMDADEAGTTSQAVSRLFYATVAGPIRTGDTSDLDPIIGPDLARAGGVR